MTIKLKLIFLLLLCSSVAPAQVKKYKKWEQAVELAKKENKDILIVLTGKEWCAPCKILEKNVLQNPKFKEYADAKFIVYEIDIPKSQLLKENSSINKKYEEFSKKYEATAFPSLVIVNHDGQMKFKISESNWELDSVMALIKFGYGGQE
ncbi:MAG: thioredoxin family protein [Chryseotalea sp.]|jgi:thioredoxin-related protein|nr:thioredoxin family protein [Flammeovirgaceae bacterium]